MNRTYTRYIFVITSFLLLFPGITSASSYFVYTSTTPVILFSDTSKWKIHYNCPDGFETVHLSNTSTISFADEISLHEKRLKSFVKKSCIILQTQIDIQNDVSSPLAFYINGFDAAYELFFDEKLVGKNGQVVSSFKKEIQGKSGVYEILPPSMALKGKHTVSLKLSSVSSLRNVAVFHIRFGNLSNIIKGIQTALIVHSSIAGIFCITAFFMLFLFLNHRKQKEYLFFFTASMSVAFFILTNEIIPHLSFPASLSVAITEAGFYFFLCAFNLSVFLFFVNLFECSLKWMVLLYVAIVILTFVVKIIFVVPQYLSDSQIHFLIAYNLVFYTLCILAIGSVILSAIVKKIPGGKTLGIGMIFLGIGAMQSIYTATGGYGDNLYRNIGWYIGALLLSMMMYLSMSFKIRDQVKKQQEALLAKSRMELEILKKSIQPHFLLNSLNAIISWLDIDPKNASKLVLALSEEMRMLLTFSQKPMIPLSQEIELCQRHIEVMSLRYDKNFVWSDEGVEEGDLVPPLVLHTLVENAFTHGFVNQSRGSISLEVKKNKNSFEMNLRNDGDIMSHRKHESTGTGLQYVEMRLQEAWPNRWSIQSHAQDKHWITTITIAKNTLL